MEKQEERGEREEEEVRSKRETVWKNKKRGERERRRR